MRAKEVGLIRPGIAIDILNRACEEIESCGDNTGKLLEVGLNNRRIQFLIFLLTQLKRQGNVVPDEWLGRTEDIILSLAMRVKMDEHLEVRR